MLPNQESDNPNQITVNTMIIDRSEWAPVRYGKTSVVASAETAREILMQNAIQMIEENGGIFVSMEDEPSRICEVCEKCRSE